jgi:hypothetical protein
LFEISLHILDALYEGNNGAISAAVSFVVENIPFNDPTSNSDDDSILDSNYSGSNRRYIDEILEELLDNSKLDSGLVFARYPIP